MCPVGGNGFGGAHDRAPRGNARGEPRARPGLVAAIRFAKMDIGIFCCSTRDLPTGAPRRGASFDNGQNDFTLKELASNTRGLQREDSTG